MKSDDVAGRVKTYEAIIKGQNIPAPGVPESFKVLLKEMQALCLDMQVLDEEQNVVEITEDLYDANQDMHRLLSGGDYRTEKQKTSGLTDIQSRNLRTENWSTARKSRIARMRFPIRTRRSSLRALLPA